MDTPAITAIPATATINRFRLIRAVPEGLEEEISLRCADRLRANDQIRFPRDNLLMRHNAVLGQALISAICKDVHAAGNLDELRTHPNPEISGSFHGAARNSGLSVLQHGLALTAFRLCGMKISTKSNHP
jgi:hypothetical protein